MGRSQVRERVRQLPSATAVAEAPRDRAPALEIVYRDPKSLHPNTRNARRHPERQIVKLVAAMKKFGFLSPVVVSPEGTLLAGHGRVEAAIRAGFAQIPTITVDHLSPTELRAYVLSDNRLVDDSEWDFAVLRDELKELSEMDLDFELDLTGFASSEIDDLIDGEVEDSENDPADQLPELNDQTVSQVGDLWQLGEHRLLVNSSLFATSSRSCSARSGRRW